VTVVLLASFLQGVTGFGFGLLAVPGLAVVMGLHAAIPISTAMCVLSSLVMTVADRRSVDWRILTLWLGGSLLGAPVGLLVFSAASDRLLSAVVAAAVAVAIAVQVYSARGAVTVARPGAPGLVAVGATAGVVGVTTGMAGPPLVLQMARARSSIDTSRATVSAFGLLFSLVATGSYVWAGSLDGRGALLSLAALPFLALGTRVGLQVSQRLGRAQFRKLTLWVLLGACVLLLIRSTR
jgi:uncharacterized membrane protein YfcA